MTPIAVMCVFIGFIGMLYNSALLMFGFVAALIIVVATRD